MRAAHLFQRNVDERESTIWGHYLRAAPTQETVIIFVHIAVWNKHYLTKRRKRSSKPQLSLKIYIINYIIIIILIVLMHYHYIWGWKYSNYQYLHFLCWSTPGNINRNILNNISCYKMLFSFWTFISV